MSATVIQRIAGVLHLGRMPAKVMEELEAEGGLRYLAEGVAETAIFINFRAPGVYSGFRKMGFVGYFALSERRIVAKAGQYNKIMVNMPFDDPRFMSFVFKAEPTYLSIKYDPSIQDPAASGQVEIRLHLPDIPQAVEILKKEGAVFDA